jgi:hypothetical protein
VALLVAFVMNALGDGDWKLLSITDKPTFQQEQRSPTLASGGKVDKLLSDFRLEVREIFVITWSHGPICL